MMLNEDIRDEAELSDDAKQMMDKIAEQALKSPSIKLTEQRVESSIESSLDSMRQSAITYMREDFDFIELATVTESKDFDKIKSRIKHPLIIQALRLLSNWAESDDPLEDGVKKHIFYGLPLSEQIRITIKTKIPRLSYGEIQNRLDDTSVIRLVHCILGLLTEVRELESAIFNYILKGEPLDAVNLREEFGDTLWYIALGLDTIDETFESVQKRTIRKLQVRYKNEFSEFFAIHRNSLEERQVLEEEESHYFTANIEDSQYLVFYSCVGTTVQFITSVLSLSTGSIVQLDSEWFRCNFENILDQARENLSTLKGENK